MLPNLIVIGAQKCGTTALHEYLDLHPQVAMSRPKELDFFVEQHNWGRGRGWYERHFAADAPVRGESSPSYTNYPEFRGVAERAAELVPDAKLVYLVRDPLDRIVSHYLHNRALGRGYPMIEAQLGDLRNSVFVAHSLYHVQLRRYLRVFPESSILVVDQADLLADRRGTLGRVFGFLGVAPDFDSPDFDRVHHVSAEKALDGRPLPVPRIESALRRRLVKRLGPDVERLRAQTGMAFETWSL
jgi:hypothetical protein